MMRPVKVDEVAGIRWAQFILSGLIGTSLLGLPILTSGCKSGGARNRDAVPLGSGTPVGTFPQSAYDAPPMSAQSQEYPAEPQYLEPLPRSGSVDDGHSYPWAQKKSDELESLPPSPVAPPTPLLPPAPSFETSVPEDAEIDVENDLIAQTQSLSLKDVLVRRPLVSLGTIEPVTPTPNVLAQADETIPSWGMVPVFEELQTGKTSSAPKLLKISASEPKPLAP